MRVGIIAHDTKKDLLVEFVFEHRARFQHHDLWATGHTGQRVSEATGLPVECLMPGPMGGDQQMGSRIAEGKIDMLFFFRDPLFAHPHEPDVSALLRVCDVRGIPVATNVATARLLVGAL